MTILVSFFFKKYLRYAVAVKGMMGRKRCQNAPFTPMKMEKFYWSYMKMLSYNAFYNYLDFFVNLERNCTNKVQSLKCSKTWKKKSAHKFESPTISSIRISMQQRANACDCVGELSKNTILIDSLVSYLLSIEHRPVNEDILCLYDEDSNIDSFVTA